MILFVVAGVWVMISGRIRLAPKLELRGERARNFATGLIAVAFLVLPEIDRASYYFVRLVGVSNMPHKLIAWPLAILCVLMLGVVMHRAARPKVASVFE